MVPSILKTDAYQHIEDWGRTTQQCAGLSAVRKGASQELIQQGVLPVLYRRPAPLRLLVWNGLPHLPLPAA